MSGGYQFFFMYIQTDVYTIAGLNRQGRKLKALISQKPNTRWKKSCLQRETININRTGNVIFDINVNKSLVIRI